MHFHEKNHFILKNVKLQHTSYIVQQLQTADENEHQPKELNFGTHITFSMYMKIAAKFLSQTLWVWDL